MSGNTNTRQAGVGAAGLGVTRQPPIKETSLFFAFLSIGVKYYFVHAASSCLVSAHRRLTSVAFRQQTCGGNQKGSEKLMELERLIKILPGMLP